MEVRVCAVVPVLNEERYIERCIDSLLAQTMKIDVMVMDGGSDDKTLDLLSKYGDKIKVIPNPGKRVAQARNLALENLSSEITHCLEIIGHSWIDSDHVEKLVNELKVIELDTGVNIGALGCRTESGDSADTISQWVEGCLLYTSPSPRDRG